MKYIDFIISKLLEKKYLAIGIVLLIVVCGLFSFSKLDIEAYPDFSSPKVQVITQMPGKSAEDVERLVTVPLEKELNGIPNFQNLYSTSIFGLSVIDIVFEDGLPSNLIRQQVLERIYQTDLPDGVKPQLGPDSSAIGEIYRYTVESKYHNKMTLKGIEDWQIERAFKHIPNIINVNSFGGPVKTFKVSINHEKTKFYGIGVEDIFNAIQNSNATTGGHYIDVNSQAFIVRGIGLLSNVKAIESVMVKEVEGVPITVKNLATVAIEPSVRLGQVGKNLEDDVIEGIVLMKKGANPTKTIREMNKKIPEIQAQLPKGVKIVPFYERQHLVDKTVHTIAHNVIMGIVFVVIVLLAYTLNYQITLIASLVIPLSILFAFILFNILNIPANLLSLGAVDFGIIVDGAIIVAENIFRHLAKFKGETTLAEKKDLIEKAVKEVSSVIIFSTLIIWFCFLPLMAFDGVAGKLFHPLAFTMGFTLLGAFLISLFVIPSLFLIFFPNDVVEKENKVVNDIVAYYKKTLEFCIANSKKFITLVGGLVIFSLLLFTQIGSEFMPNLDEGNIWLRVTILPRSTTINHSVIIANKVRQAVLEYPEVKGVVSQIGSADDGTDHNLLSNIENLIDLHSSNKWRWKFHKNKEKLVEDMSKRLSEIPGITTYFTQYIQDNVEEAVSGSKGQVVLKIYGQDLKQLQHLQDESLASLHQIDGIVDLSADKVIGQPQYQLTVDREKSARYGLNSDDIQRVIEISIGGKSATELIEDEKRFDVFLRLDKKDRDTKAKFENIMVQTAEGEFIPLKNLTKITQDQGAMVINRSENQRCAIVRFNVRGRDLGSTVQEARKQISKLELPDEYYLKWAGQSESQSRANLKLLMILPLTIAIIAILLHMSFKNWMDVLIAMSSILMALIGGVFALFITKTYFSISAGVGFIAAMGVCIQNGVIIISAIKHFEKVEKDKTLAIINATIEKLRPVLMASSVAVLGLLPAAMSNGIGAQSQKPFAITIIGSLLTGTLLSIFLIPVLYNILNKGKRNA